MLTVWKYKLAIEKYQSIDMLLGSEILKVQLQGLEPVMWVKVDTEEVKKELRRFEFIGTGEDLKSDKHNYIGTLQFQGGKFIQHLFEIYD